MELLLRVQIPSGSAHDVRVDTDADVTVAVLARELADYFGIASPRDAGVSLARAAAVAEIIDPALSIADAQLVSGETLSIGPVSVGDSGVEFSGSSRGSDNDLALEAGAWCLDVLSGEEAGRTFTLTEGSYSFDGGAGMSGEPSDDEADLSRGYCWPHFDIEIRPDGQAILLPDSESLPLRVDGVVVTEPVEIIDGSIIAIATFHMVARNMPLCGDEGDEVGSSERKDRLGNVGFFRTPYRPAVVSERKLEPLKDVPLSTDGRRFPLLSSLAPLAGGLAMYAFSQRIEFLVLTLLMPLVAIGSWVEDRRSNRKKFRRDAARFRAAIPEYAAKIDRSLHDERRERFAAAPDVIDLCRRALVHGTTLWPRGRENDDFLALRLGIGDERSNVHAAVAEQGEAELRREASVALDGSDELRDVPVTIRLAEFDAFAIHGGTLAESLAGGLILQAATLHSPEDLVILAAIDRSKRLSEQLKWLPHTRALTSPVASQHVVSDVSVARDLLAELIVIAERRKRERHDRQQITHWPRLMIVIDELLDLDPAKVAQLLDHASDAGITVVWLSKSSARIPRQVQSIVHCHDATGDGELWFSDPQREGRRVVLESIDAETVDAVVRRLAPLRDTSARNVTSAIPKTVSLFSVLGFEGDDDPERIAARVAERWLTEADYGLVTPLGVTSERVLQLDLVAQGPHVLIGGTSGSGKSELLVSFVAGLVANYAPSRINLLFIDYKGGAATEVFRAAPHTVGYVTNLNGELANRALVSLRAELNRRMRLFEGRAKDIAEMLERHPNDAPPSLVIVLDEFATLTKEIPEFVTGIVDIAQRGRSLGIHLVLATQSPSGSVDEKIQANMTSRISLRMVDAAESSAVIGSSEAVSIPVPLRGRAIAKLGPAELVEFQSAFGGTRIDDGDSRDVLIELFDTSGQRHSRARNRRGATSSSATQLDVLLRSVDIARDRLQLPPQRKPWRDELPSLIVLERLLEETGVVRSAHMVAIGRIDDPERQEQPPAVIDLEESGGLLVYGCAGSGKTTVLRTIATSAVKSSGGEDVVLFAIDFASGALRDLMNLQSCAGVASGDDLESVTRTIATLESEVQRRKPILARAHAETLSAWHDSESRLSRLLVLVDGYAAMRETFQGYGSSAVMQAWLDRFHKLVSDGRKVGLHVVITADRAAAVPAVLASSISRRIVLRQTNEQGLVDLGVSASRAKGLDLAPGRGLLDGQTIVQVACISTEASGAAQAKVLRDVDVDCSGGSSGTVGQLRTRALATTEPLEPESTSGRLEALLGIADVTSRRVAVDLDEGHLVVTGMSRSGRSTALATVASSLCANYVDVYLAGTDSSGLRELVGEKGFARTCFESGVELAGLVDELVELAQSWDLPRAFVVDDVDKITESAELVAAFNRLAKCRRVRVVASFELRSIHAGYFQSDLLHQLKNGRRKLLLQPSDDAEIQTVLGVRAPLRPGLAMPPGRGVLLADRDPVALQVGVWPSDDRSSDRSSVQTPETYMQIRN